eukprot:1168832_1
MQTIQKQQDVFNEEQLNHLAREIMQDLKQISDSFTFQLDTENYIEYDKIKCTSPAHDADVAHVDIPAQLNNYFNTTKGEITSTEGSHVETSQSISNNPSSSCSRQVIQQVLTQVLTNPTELTSSYAPVKTDSSGHSSHNHSASASDTSKAKYVKHMNLVVPIREESQSMSTETTDEIDDEQPKIQKQNTITVLSDLSVSIHNTESTSTSTGDSSPILVDVMDMAMRRRSTFRPYRARTFIIPNST